MTRVRIPVEDRKEEERELLWVIILILLATISICSFESAYSQELVLPNYVGTGDHDRATSVAVFVNPLDHSVKFPDSQTCDPFGCTVTPGPVLASGGALRIPMPTPKNGIAGIVHVTQPDPGLVVYAEIITAVGALFRADPLPSLVSAQFLDVQHEGPYNGFVFVATDAPTVLSYYGTNYQLGKDDAVILPTPSPNFKFVAQLGAHLYTFAGINSQTNGSLQIVRPR